MKECLVMFSGGKDSMLATCRMIDAGYHCNLLSFNNGSVVHEEIFQHSANRLINRFGRNVKWVGVRTTYAPFRRNLQALSSTAIRHLVSSMPDVTWCHVNCFCCQLAMWTQAIAYCFAHNIHVIGCGYKECDLFCTGSSKFMARVSTLAFEYGISPEFPVWDAPNNVDALLEEYQFLPQVYEPKCCLGCAPTCDFKSGLGDQLIRFYDDNLTQIVKESIDKSIPILETIAVTNESLEAMNYTIPTGKEGYY